jgi:hypothetical protein
MPAGRRSLGADGAYAAPSERLDRGDRYGGNARHAFRHTTLRCAASAFARDRLAGRAQIWASFAARPDASVQMIPNSLLTRALLRRGMLLWTITRAALSGVLYLAGENPLRPPVATTAAIVVLCVCAGYVELHRNRGRDLLANLGTKRRHVAGYFAVPAICGELLLRAAATVV